MTISQDDLNTWLEHFEDNSEVVATTATEEGEQVEDSEPSHPQDTGGPASSLTPPESEQAAG